MDFEAHTIEPFPPLHKATAEGLLAIGGDLTPERLVLAYRSGIFPWFNQNDPILWWSPDPRCVIFPDKFSPSRSLGKSMRNRGYRVTFDQAFELVIRACAAPRHRQPGTWITAEMQQAYISLHKLGIAHSVETWLEEKLVGGLYGVSLGSVFFGESMFSIATDASKVALSTLLPQLVRWKYTLVDCQVSSAHIISLGAVEITRDQFAKRLKSDVPKKGIVSNWLTEQDWAGKKCAS